jgi:ATP-dependent exoDNAse (exonuclease V) beta subunit
VGCVLHRALADWECLAFPPARQGAALEAFARREGLLAKGAVQDAARRAQRMLERLKHDPLYGEIQAAPEHYPELPFILQTPSGPLEGVIDLLLRDRMGRWRVLEWKAEWISPEFLPERRQPFVQQLAIYTLAVERITGQAPGAALVYFTPRLFVDEVSPAELAAARAGLFGAA